MPRALILKDVLQKQWNFKGFVVSDWGSTYSTVETVNAGMDLEMPGGEPMKAWLKKAENAGGGQRRWLVGPGKSASGNIVRAKYPHLRLMTTSAACCA